MVHFVAGLTGRADNYFGQWLENAAGAFVIRAFICSSCLFITSAV